MKIFFWLLIAVNVILFAVMQSGLVNDAQTVPPLNPLSAEKITLITSFAPVAESAPVAIDPPSSAAAQPASSPASAPVAATAMVKGGSCFEWGEFSGSDLEQATKALKQLSLGDQLSQREVDRVIGFWVYIAPLKDKAAVGQKVAQLKALGVKDYFVVQEAGEWLNAISLGLFKSQDSAKNFLQGLRSKGVNSAKIGERAGKGRATVFLINGLDAKTTAKLTELQKEFASSELKSASCH